MTSTSLTFEEVGDEFVARVPGDAKYMRRVATYLNHVCQCGGDPIAWFVGRSRHDLIRGIAAAKALMNDGEVCDRCGGYGGADCWPGFTCFQCGGRGWL